MNYINISLFSQRESRWRKFRRNQGQMRCTLCHSNKLEISQCRFQLFLEHGANLLWHFHRFMTDTDGKNGIHWEFPYIVQHDSLETTKQVLLQMGHSKCTWLENCSFSPSLSPPIYLQRPITLKLISLPVKQPSCNKHFSLH